MNHHDFRQPPCKCPDCRQADVTDLEQVRDPHTGKFLHGHALRNWYLARDEFKRRARAAVGAKGRHAAGFEKLVN